MSDATGPDRVGSSQRSCVELAGRRDRAARGNEYAGVGDWPGRSNV